MSKLCVNKLCVNKLCVSELCVRKERREVAGVTRDDCGSARPKTRTPHKDVGKKHL